MKCLDKTKNEYRLDDLHSLIKEISSCSESMLNKTIASHIDMFLNKPNLLSHIKNCGWSTEQKKFITPISREKLIDSLNDFLEENQKAEYNDYANSNEYKETDEDQQISNEYRRLIIEVRKNN